jgi:glycosyltransferase involved in cell wall biosynthesis
MAILVVSAIDRQRTMIPQVSVIIPSYNHARFLRQRIDTVLKQSVPDLELILLDDCSTDGSQTIVDEFRNHPKVSACIVNTKNSGSTFRQWARGLQHARADYVWIAESDDLALPNLLATLTQVLDAHANVGVAYCQSAQIDDANVVIGSWRGQMAQTPNSPWNSSFVASGPAVVRHYLLHGNVIPNASAVVFRKRHLAPEVLVEAADNYTINGDWYIWSSMLLKSDLAYVDQELNACRMHSQKGSRRNIENFNNIAEFYRLRSFLYRSLALSTTDQAALNSGLFELWMAQRRSFGLSKEAPETRKVLEIAALVDPEVHRRLASAPN